MAKKIAAQIPTSTDPVELVKQVEELDIQLAELWGEYTTKREELMNQRRLTFGRLSALINIAADMRAGKE